MPSVPTEDSRSHFYRVNWFRDFDSLIKGGICRATLDSPPVGVLFLCPRSVSSEASQHLHHKSPMAMRSRKFQAPSTQRTAMCGLGHLCGMHKPVQGYVHRDETVALFGYKGRLGSSLDVSSQIGRALALFNSQCWAWHSITMKQLCSSTILSDAGRIPHARSILAG
jgi:hypothetical protein